MGNWNDILNEINEPSTDRVRRRYLRELQQVTGRNVLCYYSGWLQKTGSQFGNITSITDEDKGAFMSCFHKMESGKGLDLVIHSPGGYVAATESLITYVRSKFGSDIRTFVPQLAMSGGTLLALTGLEIWMGNYSNLGPIDPQFGSMPMVTLLEEVETAYKEIQANPQRLVIWQPIFAKIQPTQLTQAKQAIELSKSIAIQTLMNGMFKKVRGKKKRCKICSNIAEQLTDVETHKQHDRHIHPDDCENIGLIIKHLESDDKLQDAVLSVHNAFMVTLANTPAAKIIENHRGEAFVKNVAASMQRGAQVIHL